MNDSDDWRRNDKIRQFNKLCENETVSLTQFRLQKSSSIRILKDTKRLFGNRLLEWRNREKTKQGIPQNQLKAFVKQILNN